MKASKKVVGNLSKCYSVAPLRYKGKDHFLVAAEKVDRCILFDLDGNEEETVWTEPGGVMSMVQVPGTDGQFLATHRFYSPNDGANASIVIVTPRGKNDWERRTLCALPFVHRFDILQTADCRYIIACALKSAHEHKDDWRFPGKVYAAELPDDLSGFCDETPLALEVVKDGLLKNHGYYRTYDKNKNVSALISSESGIFRIFPPEKRGGQWREERLLDVPASDAVLVDFDSDGEDELLVLSPFHGDELSVYKKRGGNFEKVYEHPERLDFLHAMYGGELCGQPCAVVGHRGEEKKLLCLRYDGGYVVDCFDTGRGPANVLRFVKDGRDHIVSANRETDEIAVYAISK